MESFFWAFCNPTIEVILPSKEGKYNNINTLTLSSCPQRGWIRANKVWTKEICTSCLLKHGIKHQTVLVDFKKLYRCLCQCKQLFQQLNQVLKNMLLHVQHTVYPHSNNISLKDMNAFQYLWGIIVACRWMQLKHIHVFVAVLLLHNLTY